MNKNPFVKSTIILKNGHEIYKDDFIDKVTKILARISAEYKPRIHFNHEKPCDVQCFVPSNLKDDLGVRTTLGQEGIKFDFKRFTNNVSILEMTF